ncbi:hypothetical protein [Vulcanisaeta distributa]|nr:hypothetical protein [Vulcanisaeta distributa]
MNNVKRRNYCTIIDDLGIVATFVGALFIYFVILMALALPIMGLAFVHGGPVAGIIVSAIIVIIPTYFFVKDLVRHIRRSSFTIRNYVESIFHVRGSCPR